MHKKTAPVSRDGFNQTSLPPLCMTRFYTYDHEAQILTYMKFAGIRTGLLFNFNVTILKNGLQRFVL
jgi:hypothetical protein